MPMKNQNKEKTKMNKKLSMVITILVGILIFSLMAMGLWILSGEGRKPKDKPVLCVGEETVYLDEVNLYCLENVAQLGITQEQLKNQKADDGTPASDYYKEEILQLIMDTKVTYIEACREGITLTEGEEEEVKKDAMAYISSVNASILNEFGITKETVIESYKQRFIAQKLTDSVSEGVEVEEQKYATVYIMMFPKVEIDENGDYVRGSDGETPVLLSEEEIEQKKEDANGALEELKAEKDPDEVAEKYGVSLVSGQESNLVGSFGEPFDGYISSLKEGECTSVIDIESCYFIIKMLDENNEDFAEQILSYYRKDKEKEAVEEAVNKWYEECGISHEAEFTGTVWENLSLDDFARYVEE